MAEQSGVVIEGMDGAFRNLREIRQTLLPAIGDALYDESAYVMRESRKLVPVDSSDLRDSGEVHDPVIRGSDVSVELTYDHRGNLDYAERIHEDMAMAHPGGGQAKFLEQPFVEEADLVEQHVADTVARDLAPFGVLGRMAE